MRHIKLCFVGHARAGKTSTLMSLAGRPFDPGQEIRGTRVSVQSLLGGVLRLFLIRVRRLAMFVEVLEGTLGPWKSSKDISWGNRLSSSLGALRRARTAWPPAP